MKKYEKPNRYLARKLRKKLKISVGEFVLLTQVLRPHIETWVIRRAAKQASEELISS